MGRDGAGESSWGAIDRTRLDELVARGRDGDPAAIETRYGLFKGPVFGLVYRYALSINLGPAVDTGKPESSPTHSSDGRSFFFTRETDIHRVSAKVMEALRPQE